MYRKQPKVKLTMLKKLPLLLFILGLSYCTMWVLGYSHLKKLEDDQYVGKTLIIYPSAGKFVLDDSWYFGKRSGDSYFSSQSPYPEGDPLPVLYRMVGKYKDVNHGGRLLAGSGLIQHLVKPVKGEIDRRLFFTMSYLESCIEQTDLIDPETGIKVDFVCH